MAHLQGLKRKLLGYGVFSGCCPGAPKGWRFQEDCGISPTKAEAETRETRIVHCIPKEVRRVYNVTKLNIGTEDLPTWQKAQRWMRQQRQNR